MIADERRGPFWDMLEGWLPAPRAGALYAEGSIVHRGRDIVFLEGRLTDPDGQLIATSTATARVVPFPQPTAAS